MADGWRIEALEKLQAGRSPTELAKEYGVSRSTIYRLRSVPGDTEKLATERTRAFGEFGVSGLNRFGGSVEEDYLQPWKALSDMVPLVKEMLDNPTIGAIIFAAEMTIRKAEWTVNPASDAEVDKRAAEFVESCMNDCSHTWNDHIQQALSMIGYGFSPFEIVYKRRLGPDVDPQSDFDDGLIGWRKFAFRAQDTLAPGKEWDFDDAGGVQAMNQLSPPDFIEKTIPIQKMLLYRTTSAKQNPQGRSALRPCYQAYYYAKQFMQVEGIAAERLGAGLPIMYLGGGTQKGTGAGSDYEFAKKAVRDIRVDSQFGVVVPYPKQGADGKGVLLELLSPPSRGMVDFDKIIERYNKMMAQVLLAQFIFLGMVERGTQALAVRTTDFFTEAIKGWLEVLSGVVNRFGIPRLLRLNAPSFIGIAGYPKIMPGEISQIDVQRFMEALEIGLRTRSVTLDEGIERTIRQLLELPERGSPEAGEEYETPQPIFGMPPGAQRGAGPDMGGKEGQEEFALRRAEGTRKKWANATNTYQKQLERLYSDWINELADELAEEEDDGNREAMMVAAFALFASRMKDLGRISINRGAMMGLGSVAPSPDFLSMVADRIRMNEQYVDELVRSIDDRLHDKLVDPAVIVAGSAGITASMLGLGSRVEQYAGGMWAMINEASAFSAQFREDSRVYWELDPIAQHCEDCFQFGNREYASYGELVMQTGGILPAFNTACYGNCRCTLLVWSEQIGDWVPAG